MPYQNSTNLTTKDGDYSAGVLQTSFTEPYSLKVFNESYGYKPFGISRNLRESQSTFYFPNYKIQETRANLHSEINRLYKKIDLLEPVKNSIRLLENELLKSKAESILDFISNEIDKVDDLTDYCPVYGFLLEDCSFLIEWIFNDFRLGFSTNQDLDGSSWFLVSKNNLGGINASGSIDDNNSRIIIPWLLSFINMQMSM